MRKMAGEIWNDHTLNDWNENDYRLFCGYFNLLVSFIILWLLEIWVMKFRMKFWQVLSESLPLSKKPGWLEIKGMARLKDMDL